MFFVKKKKKQTSKQKNILEEPCSTDVQSNDIKSLEDLYLPDLWEKVPVFLLLTHQKVKL